jgi:hypothetical protein
MTRLAAMPTLLVGHVVVATVAGCAGRAPNAGTAAVSGESPSSRSEANTSLTGKVLPMDRERVAQYGMPDLIGEVGLNGIVTYMRPRVGLWPRSGDTAHVYYYLDQKDPVLRTRTTGADASAE